MARSLFRGFLAALALVTCSVGSLSAAEPPPGVSASVEAAKSAPATLHVMCDKETGYAFTVTRDGSLMRMQAEDHRCDKPRAPARTRTVYGAADQVAMDRDDHDAGRYRRQPAPSQ